MQNLKKSAATERLFAHEDKPRINPVFLRFSNTWYSEEHFIQLRIYPAFTFPFAKMGLPLESDDANSLS